MSIAAVSPRWDMDSIYPGVESEEFNSELKTLYKDLDDLKSDFDRIGVRRLETTPSLEGAQANFEAVLKDFNSFYEKLRKVMTYVNCLVAADSRDEIAQAKLSELQTRLVAFWKLETRLNAWIGSLPVEELIANSELAKAHAYALHKARIQAQHQMSPSEEDLAADLNPSGAQAWAKLHGNFTSRISVNVDGENIPMSAVRNLAYSENRETRKKAYTAELNAWKEHELPIAAALNGVKGQTLVLNARRAWESPLEESLFRANIDQKALDAMMQAAHDSFPMFRRYLDAKAAALNIDKLAWFDIFAPVGSSNRSWSYDEGMEFVADTFATYSDELSSFAKRAFRENWIDAEPRDGKRDGAFCAGVIGDVSRILMNFKPAFGAVSTLAHELGHGYHNVCLAKRTSLQRATPMTLAETASIFCETIVRRAALENADKQERIAILEAALQGACQVVVDITSRFLFESAVFERRTSRELSPAELCDAMKTAQLQTYGEGLDSELLHPYMWAAKPHYYGSSFYNYPYMFGLLFGLGLFAQYLDSPTAFKSRYDDLLSKTGMASASELAADFGIDIHSAQFWQDSLKVIEQDVDAFVEAVG
ncbi:MAG: M3 family oligoendopeptidase [Fimbriimonadales bacterium]|nr:M3 family oligoendopeptidase [Fimbriimonadales bacterium]